MEMSIFDLVPDNVITAILVSIAVEASLQCEPTALKNALGPVTQFGRTSKRMRKLVYDAKFGALFIWGRFDANEFAYAVYSRKLGQMRIGDIVRVVPANILRLCQRNSAHIHLGDIHAVVRRMPQLTDIRISEYACSNSSGWARLAALPCRKLRAECDHVGSAVFMSSLRSLHLRTTVDLLELSRTANLDNITRLKLKAQNSQMIRLVGMASLKRLKIVFLEGAEVDWRHCPPIEKLKLVHMYNGRCNTLKNFERAGCRESIRQVHMVWHEQTPDLSMLVGCPLLEKVDCDGHLFDLLDVPVLATIPGICNFGLRLTEDLYPFLKTYLDYIPPQHKLALSFDSDVGTSQANLMDIFTSKMCTGVQTLGIAGHVNAEFWTPELRAVFKRCVAEHVHTIILRHNRYVGMLTDSVVALLESCTHLTSLVLEVECDLREFSDRLPNIVGNIREIVIGGDLSERDIKMDDFSWLSHWHSLRKLWHDSSELDENPDDGLIKAVLKHCPNLQCFMGSPVERPANLPGHIRYICQ